MGSGIKTICQQMFPGIGAGEKVGTELDVITVAQSRPLIRGLGGRELVDVSCEILNQRMIKDSEEIESIKKACYAVHAGHLATVSCLRAGMRELDLAANTSTSYPRSGPQESGGCARHPVLNSP